MIVCFCGEDTATSRKAYQDYLQSFKKKDPQVRFELITAKDLPHIVDNPPDTSLFSTGVIYTIEQLNKQLGRKSAKDTYWVALDQIANNPDLQVAIWERDLPKRSVRYSSVSAIKVKESKPDASIFSLVALCSPSKKTAFLNELNRFCDKTNEMFVYIMLVRHIRNLVVMSTQPELVKLPPWQLNQIKADARAWKDHNLLGFYDKLIAIETSLKTGKNAYTIKQSLDILACYYL